MDFQNMVRAIESAELSDPDLLLCELSGKLPRVYTEKSMAAYCDAFVIVLRIGMKLNYGPMMMYLPARPKVCESLVVQFQQINKTIATRHNHKDWFHDLFALFTGIAVIWSLSWNDIGDRIVAASK